MDQVREIAGLVGDALGREAIGIYLHGSSVLGGLQPASDVDVLVVSGRRMDDRQRRALLEGLLRISGHVDGARPVELTVVVQSEVRPWRSRRPATSCTASGCATSSRPVELLSRNRCRISPC